MRPDPTFEQVSEMAKAITLGVFTDLFEEFPDVAASLRADIAAMADRGHTVTGFAD